MGHEIEIIDGEASMAYVGDVPWHSLGFHLEPGVGVHQMMKAAKLDWTVEKMPGFYKNSAGLYVRMPRDALVRSTDGKILDTVTPDWNPLQNEEAFNFFHDFVTKGDMEMNTAGSLRGGQLVWALAKVKDGFFVGKKDQVDSYLLFSNPHQFGKAIDIRFTPIRVVCWNTICLALGSRGLTVDQQVVKVNHRKIFSAERVMETLGIAHKLLDGYKEAAQFIASRRFGSESLNEYFAEIFPRSGDKGSISRNHEKALTVIQTQPGHDMAEGSWWQAFNAVTYMTDHLLGRSVETRLDSAWFGSNRNLKSKALNEAVRLAELSPAL